MMVHRILGGVWPIADFRRLGWSYWLSLTGMGEIVDARTRFPVVLDKHDIVADDWELRAPNTPDGPPTDREVAQRFATLVKRVSGSDNWDPAFVAGNLRVLFAALVEVLNVPKKP